LVDGAWVDPGRRDWRSDHDANRARPLEPPTSRPITTRVVRHGHDGAASRSREQRAAQSITFRLPGRHASAFGEDHDPEPFPKAPLTLIDDLLDRAIAA